MKTRTKIAVLLNEVDLGQNVDMGQFEMEHGSQGQHEDGNILRSVRDVVCVAEMDGR